MLRRRPREAHPQERMVQLQWRINRQRERRVIPVWIYIRGFDNQMGYNLFIDLEKFVNNIEVWVTMALPPKAER